MLLLQRAFKRESEVENWIQTYDSEMGEKQVRAAGIKLEGVAAVYIDCGFGHTSIYMLSSSN